MKKRWLILTAAILVTAVWIQETAFDLPDRRDMEQWLTDGTFQAAVEALREAEDGDSWTLTIDRDVVRSRGPGTDAQTSLAETSYGEGLVPLMSEYGLREVTVACDAGEHLAVTFGAVRYDNEDFTKDGVFLIWIDPGYHGRDSRQPDRTLDAGYADEILRWWPAEEERIREHWYFWSVSGEPTC